MLRSDIEFKYPFLINSIWINQLNYTDHVDDSFINNIHTTPTFSQWIDMDNYFGIAKMPLEFFLLPREDIADYMIRDEALIHALNDELDKIDIDTDTLIIREYLLMKLKTDFSDIILGLLKLTDDELLCLLPDLKYTTKLLAKYGYINCLKYAHKNGCSWDILTCLYSAKNGHLDCLKYAHENGCPWNELTCLYAAKNGHVECLKYAHENGCPWYKWTCYDAAKNGHLDCLKYAHENGCPWNELTCLYAAKNGHVECLKYAHENGCPWYKWTCEYAARNGHVECIKYIHENGCQ